MDRCLGVVFRLGVLVDVGLEFFGGGVEGELMVGAPEVQGVAADHSQWNSAKGDHQITKRRRLREFSFFHEECGERQVFPQVFHL